ncbi:cytochrome P450 [Roridomyces roridus]|uniref:Cytochrome P450 n=1 Tax=Roridomyces roridus TaxID=1738132 RepID=A0AAD7BA33_9AGAR|nr:cytochrome P450 [Roridomyces roridus]
MLAQLLWPIALTLAGYAIYHTSYFIYREWASPLRFVEGPPSASLLLGNLSEMVTAAKMSGWQKQFGKTFRFRGLFSMSQLQTADIKALNHIFANPEIYRKPFNNVVMQRLHGEGLLSVELGAHTQQRRLLNPAFGTAQIRLLTEIFVEKSIQLRNIWAKQVDATTSADGVQIDVSSWLRRVALDIIGEAGFNHHFNSLDEDGKPDELDEAFTELFHSPKAQHAFAAVTAQARFPILRLLPIPGASVIDNASASMHAAGERIVSNSLAVLEASEEGGKSLGAKRDLLSVLLKANVSPGVLEHQRLTESEMVAQIPTFLAAGHETSSSAVTWALHALSLSPLVQSKLREELLGLNTENPSMEELNSLPYLENIVRETLRVHSPIPSIQRQAVQDDVLPLSTPYIGKDGTEHESLPIPKGQLVDIPILAVNTDKDIWGEDAELFRPERWENIPTAANSVPGIWSHLLTFFAGPHHCIGFRFSLVEIKALLFVLLRSFEFVPAVPDKDIMPTALGLRRPLVKGQDGASRLPLLVKLYQSEHED